MIPKLIVFADVDFLDPHPNYSGEAGAYVSVIPDNESKSSFVTMLSDLGLDDEPEGGFHCTVMYSKKATDTPLKINPFVPYRAMIKGLTFWPGEKGQGFIVVAILESSDLRNRHEEWKACGLKHSFPEYTPHVTLVKGVKKEDYEDKLTDATAYFKATPVYFTDEKLVDNEDCLEDIKRNEDFPDSGFPNSDGRVTDYADMPENHHRGLDWMDDGADDKPNR